MKLNPEELDVTSFDTTADAQAEYADIVLQPGLTTINDPTAATRCFICPPRTYDNCW